MRRLNPNTTKIALFILLPIALLIAVSLGSVSIPIEDLIHHLWRQQKPTEYQQLIIEKIRAPRVLLCAIIGSILASCGVVMQGLFRNPLADPSLIGVSSGAALGASLMMILGTLTFPQFPDPAGSSLITFGSIATGAFIGGVLATFLVYRLATRDTGTSVPTMLLAGIAISAIAAGVNNLLMYIADNSTLRQISLWQMGGFDRTRWSDTLLAGLILILGILCFRGYTQALNALLLGESEARNLGFNIQKMKLQLITVTALMIGIATALTGMIGFVGLVVPHIMRLLIGPSHQHLLIVSALAGAIFLVLADLLARSVISPAELPVGIITALLGAPFFILLLRKSRLLY